MHGLLTGPLSRGAAAGQQQGGGRILVQQVTVCLGHHTGIGSAQTAAGEEQVLGLSAVLGGETEGGFAVGEDHIPQEELVIDPGHSVPVDHLLVALQQEGTGVNGLGADFLTHAAVGAGGDQTGGHAGVAGEAGGLDGDGHLVLDAAGILARDPHQVAEMDTGVTLAQQAAVGLGDGLLLGVVHAVGGEHGVGVSDLMGREGQTSGGLGEGLVHALGLEVAVDGLGGGQTVGNGTGQAAAHQLAAHEHTGAVGGGGTGAAELQAEVGAVSAGGDVNGGSVQGGDVLDGGVELEIHLLIHKLALNFRKKFAGVSDVPQGAAQAVGLFVHGDLELAGGHAQRAGQAAHAAADDDDLLFPCLHVVAVGQRIGGVFQCGGLQRPQINGAVVGLHGADPLTGLITELADDAGESDCIQISAIGGAEGTALDLGNKISNVKGKGASCSAGRLVILHTLLQALLELTHDKSSRE